MITTLKQSEIFVFGSNGQGNHAGGAAAFARRQGWTKTGHAHGLLWQSFAIDTMDGIAKLEIDLNDLAITARHNPALTFLLTPIGQGIARYSKQQILNILPVMPSNVIFTEEWEEK